MNSLGKGTVPESGEGIHACGFFRAEEILATTKKPKDPANIMLTDEGYEFRLAKGRHELNVTLDLSVGEMSVEVLPAYEDDCAFCYLRLKDQRGNKASLDLSLDVARQIRKKLDAYFTEERARQEARLA
jgi:hypothetical protein